MKILLLVLLFACCENKKTTFVHDCNTSDKVKNKVCGLPFGCIYEVILSDSLIEREGDTLIKTFFIKHTPSKEPPEGVWYFEQNQVYQAGEINGDFIMCEMRLLNAEDSIRFMK